MAAMTKDQPIGVPKTEDVTEPAAGFQMPSIPNLKDIFVGDLAQVGDWVVADVEGQVFWPVQTQRISYRGEELWIIPLTQECHGAVAMRQRPGLDRIACQKVLLRFLSSLSWLEERGVSLVHGFGGGSLPRPSGRPSRVGLGISQQFDLTNLPEPSDARACLALAIMREGRSLNHPGYAFLSFFRVIEVALPDGLRRGQWITAKIPTLTGWNSKPAVDKLATSGIQDIGAHLRESNRHAMAHAQRGHIIDPDDYEETRRLADELPNISDLAVIAVEEFFGVETRHTIYRKHLYELAGFKTVLGDDVIQRLLAGDAVAEGTMINVPDINVGLRDRAPVAPLLNLSVRNLWQDGKSLVLEYASSDEQVEMRLRLNFETERLDFEMLTDMRIRDNGTASGMTAVIEFAEFRDALFGNGQLHIYDVDTGDLLGRKDPYIPVNMYFDPKRAAAHLAKLRQRESARRGLEAGGWSLTIAPDVAPRWSMPTVWTVGIK
jgi:hypothetical protein